MKKLILAISSVFCLQLGFIAYNANDPAVETSFIAIDQDAADTYLASYVGEPFATDPLPYDLEGEDVIEPESFTMAVSDVIQPTVSQQARSARRAVTHRKRAVRNTFVSIENPLALRPVRVTYRVHDGYEFRPLEPKKYRTEYPVAPMAEREEKKFEISAKAVARPKKKNLFARIVKKPYDWLKAIGSTFK